MRLEIAVSSVGEAQLAVACGADRLELSCALEYGGLTPTIGLLRAIRQRVLVPVWVLLRPRFGGFVYSSGEHATMLADAAALLEEGADGIVYGALTEDGRIDYARCRALVECASGQAVFHRAFDFLADPLAALDELIALGFARVLTSGGAPTAEAGVQVLARLVKLAGGRIEVLPAGRIRPPNVATLVRATGCNQIHAAARVPAPDAILAHKPQLAEGMGRATELSADLVRGLRRELDQLADSLS